jgi:hypothetical protein
MKPAVQNVKDGYNIPQTSHARHALGLMLNRTKNPRTPTAHSSVRADILIPRKAPQSRGPARAIVLDRVWRLTSRRVNGAVPW